VLTLGAACDSFTTISFTTGGTAPLPLAIPDGTGTGPGGFGADASNIQTVTGVTGNISDLNLGVKINHTWVGDLQVDLSHLGVTAVVVIDLMGHVTLDCAGCGNDNIDVVLDDDGTGGAIEAQCNATPPAAGSPPSFTPANPLSAFDGLVANGAWTLRARDGCSADTGSIISWSLSFLNGTSTACAPQCSCKGDMNGSNSVTGADIAKFVDCVVPPAPTGCTCSDMNNDSVFNGSDVSLFVTKLLVGTCP